MRRFPFRRSLVVDLAVVLFARCAVSAIVLSSGFIALSDDDFSRTVIAQRFAQAPALDPSGTSWLPVPFWGVGMLMAVAGPTWQVARVAAVLAGLLASVLTWSAARLLGLSRSSALVGTVLTLGLPYAALLGVAAVPDYPTAALALLTAGCLVPAPDALGAIRFRLLGAGSLFVATLSRYEVWPVAATFALMMIHEGITSRARSAAWSSSESALQRSSSDPPRAESAVYWFLGAAGLGVLGPALWLLHGHVRHGEPLFFVKRVAAYEAALGGPVSPWIERALAAPWALVHWHPGLMGGTALLLTAALALRIPLRHWLRPALLSGSIVVFLIAGDLRGAGATHHEERSLLPLWMAACLFCGDVVVRLARRSSPARYWVGAALVTWLLVAWTWLEPPERDWHGYAQRRSELAIGEAARALVRPGERLLIDTPDYGFFAVMAAFGRPSDAAPLSDQDPRRKLQQSPTASLATLRLATAGVRWLVVHRAHRSLALSLGRPRAASGDFTLVELHARSAR